MKKTKLFFLSLTLGVFTLIVLSSSCKEDEVITVEADSIPAFLSLDSGFWIEYQVDSIVHLDLDDQNEVDTSIEAYHFFIREEIDSSYIDGVGNTAWVISRYQRTSDTLPWDFVTLWTAQLKLGSLERVEDNRRYIRMIFPIKAGLVWNGNAYNTLGLEEYKYEDLYQTLTYGAFTFDSTVTVNQNDFVSNINRISKKEIYGSHVGLLYKSIEEYTTVNTTNGTVILNGLEYFQTVTAYKH